MSMLLDIKADYSNVSQDASQTEFREQLYSIKAQSDVIEAEHQII